MKIFEGNEAVKKSWSIKLINDEDFDEPFLVAVDSVTGKVIAYLINFSDNGEIVTVIDAHQDLYDNGYNPFEHGNKFDDSGRIRVSLGGQ